MLEHSFSKENFPSIQPKPPLMQLEAISSHVIANYLGEETDTHLTTTSFQVVVERIRSPLSLLFCILNSRTWNLALLKLVQVASAQLSSLSRSLCRALLPSSTLALPPNMESSANLLREHSIPSSRSLIKILNKTGLKTEPWGTPLVTGRQLDLTPFTNTLCAWS